MESSQRAIADLYQDGSFLLWLLNIGKTFKAVKKYIHNF